MKNTIILEDALLTFQDYKIDFVILLITKSIAIKTFTISTIYFHDNKK